jgi:ABC-type polar amino acid transport system ATPase subunit
VPVPVPVPVPASGAPASAAGRYARAWQTTRGEGLCRQCRQVLGGVFSRYNLLTNMLVHTNITLIH